MGSYQDRLDRVEAELVPPPPLLIAWAEYGETADAVAERYAREHGLGVDDVRERGRFLIVRWSEG